MDGGRSTQIFAEYANSIVCVDHWEGNHNDIHKNIVAQTDPSTIFLENVRPFMDKVTAIRSSSDTIGDLLRDEQFDFVFIDGDHRYSQTKKDILNCLPKVKAEGMITGHDCEGRINIENEETILASLDQDHVDSLFLNFKHTHPGVVWAVHELLTNVFLFATDGGQIQLQDDSGNIIFGHSSIWSKRILAADAL